MPILDFGNQFNPNMFENQDLIVSSHLSKIRNLTACIKWKIKLIFENRDFFSKKYTFNMSSKWKEV